MLASLPFIFSFIAGVLVPLINRNNQVTIVIIGTNDIHGTAFPTELFRTDTLEKYKYGGLIYMARIIQIIKNEYPNRALYFDAGDQFQGGIESSSLVSSGQIMNDFYKIIGLDASAIGNHQFDFQFSFLNSFLSGRPSPNMAANLKSETGQSNFLQKQQSYRIFTLQNDISIGVIGLSTVQTPATTSGFTKNYFPAYKFEAYKDHVINLSAILRSKNVNAILIVSHVGNSCNSTFQYANWTINTPQPDCNLDEITYLLDAIPAGTVDGVIQGHRHRNIHQFYKGIPIMGTINGGYYLNAMYLKFNKQTKKLKDIIIEGPIPVCERVFKNTNRCNYLNKTEIITAGQLKKWQFHNKQVYGHPQLDNIFQTNWRKKMSPYLVELAVNQVYLERISLYENQLGNLITNLVHDVAPDADFVILNSGGFRSIWTPGVIQEQHFYNMFPFSSNLIQTFQINGLQLFNTISVVQVGVKAFYQTWGLKQTVTLINNVKGFVDVSWFNGTRIDNSTNYKGVTIDFLLNGGDDFSKAINITYTPRNVVTLGEFRTLIRPKLVALGKIQQNTLIDKNNPRLKIN